MNNFVTKYFCYLNFWSVIEMVQPDVVPDVADVGARNVYLGAAQALTFHCENKNIRMEAAKSYHWYHYHFVHVIDQIEQVPWNYH